MAEFGAVIFITVFITVMGLLFNNMGLATFTVLNPITFAIGQVLLLIVIGVSNTPVAKGVALAIWGGWIFTYLFTLNIPDPVGNIIYAVILVPSFLIVGMTMLEIGKG